MCKKQLFKLEARLMKLYNIDASFCPNITNQNYSKNLRYLVYKRYIEKSIQYPPWHDLIAECLSQADYLAHTFIKMLESHDDYQEINKWIGKLNINPSTLPPYVIDKIFFFA